MNECGCVGVVRGCGGCDGGAIEFVREDGGRWRSPRPTDFAPPCRHPSVDRAALADEMTECPDCGKVLG